MKTKHAVSIALLALLFSMSPAQAEDSEDGDELDATMRLMGNAEAELPDAVINPIKLPDHLIRAESIAVTKSAKGPLQANDARQGRENGLTTADAARDRAQDMAEAAKETRENHGRSEDLPDPPNRPEVPNPGGPPGQ